MILHLSLHPRAFISLPTYITSPTCSPSVSPPSLSLLFLSFSPQIIANHHMQSISFASGGDPVSHQHSLSQLKSHSGLFPSFFSLHILPSCLLSLSIPMNTTHSKTASLVLQSLSSKLDLIASCHFSFSSMYVFNFCRDLKSAAFALSLYSSSSSSSSFQPFYPTPALHLFPSMKCSPPLPPNCLTLSPSGYG